MSVEGDNCDAVTRHVMRLDFPNENYTLEQVSKL